MKVTMISLTEQELECRDYSEMLIVEIDGKKELSVYDGEPEDNNLSRNFSDIWGIGKLLERAYNAGKHGEEFEIEDKKVDEY